MRLNNTIYKSDSPYFTYLFLKNIINIYLRNLQQQKIDTYIRNICHFT